MKMGLSGPLGPLAFLGCYSRHGLAKTSAVFLLLLTVSAAPAVLPPTKLQLTANKTVSDCSTERCPTPLHSPRPTLYLTIDDRTAWWQSFRETETPSSSSQQKKSTVNVLISESLANIRTLYTPAGQAAAPSLQGFILPTKLVANNSSYPEAVVGKELPLTERLETDSLDMTGTPDKESNVPFRNYYDAIVPTKSISAEELKIAQTEIREGNGSGVSMGSSRPLNMTTYKRTKRGFGSPDEEPAQEVKSDEGKKKLIQWNSSGKSYNEIEQTLRKIAKVTINNDERQPQRSVVVPVNFRESREEENRKASPDIQDIITGIVNILNGKNTKQSDGNAGRPRPTGTRINNRGPPRISDVPPLDFDGPPSYRPLPPPPPKRMPPPYPFDIPPSITNIPLPPQPHKPLTKLPPHPFIDGVPIPKIVVPDEQLKKRPEYDTISMSEPTHPAALVNVTKNPIRNATADGTGENFQTAGIGNSNSTIIPANNTTVGKPVKVSGQVVSPSSGSAGKNPNKRIRPNPVNDPNEKPVVQTTTPVTEQEKNGAYSEVKTGQNSTIVEAPTAHGSNKTQTLAKISKGTQNESDEIKNPSKVSANASTALNIKPIKDAEVQENKTEVLLSVPTTLPTAITYTQELPILLEPSIGIGEATPVLETSILEISMLPPDQTLTASAVMTTQTSGQVMTETPHVYKARPGIVLDDPEYKPGGLKRPVVTGRPIITAPPLHSHFGEVFDVTVHAVQGQEDSPSGKPVIVPVNVDGVKVHKSQANQVDVSVITKAEDGQNFVSIDGKRTYINLFGEVSATNINPTSTQAHITGTGYVVPRKEPPLHQSNANRPLTPASPPRRPYKRPNHPPVRIDTCIVGDDITCDTAQNEMCRTEDGVSSCHCRPGYNRRNHRDTCRRVVSMVTSLRIDRLYDRRIKWQDNLRDPDSDEYQQLSYEASQAIESAMSMTPFSDDFINSRINSIYSAKNLDNNEPAVYVNVTIQLEENLDTMRPTVKHDIQRHLLRVIQRRNNNVGNSALWVDASPGSVLALQDVDECSSSDLHDCHERAVCLNTFGSFKCQCPSGSRDPWVGNIHREGRFCETCSPDYCNNRGECSFEHGQQVCHCSGSFYGSQCEIDGEVLGVAIGASVAAAIIIVLTLICLCMWSRRWSREQKSAVGAGMGSPVFGYMATGPAVKTPSVGSPPYQVSLEDRIRWAQIADVMAKSNHYAQPEPVNATTRTSFGGFPTLASHTMNMTATLPLPTITPPVPLPRLTLANKQPLGTYGAHSQFGSLHQSNHGMRSSLETSSSEEDADRVDLLGRNFNAPRPKSRTSVANQSGIYYDVDFDRSEAYSKQNTIPLNTYTLNPQHQVRPYFR